jgi:hypothetical protein
MLGSYTLDLVLCGVAYLILVYLMVTLMKKRKGDTGSSDDDDDGGISVKGPPVIDLPPGVCLPDGSPRLILKEEEEREEIIF